MSRFKAMFDEFSEYALCTFGVLVAVFVLANVLFAAKSVMGIDLFPGHAGSFFAAGRGIYESVNG